MNSIIEVIGVTKKYKNISVVDDVSITLEKGKIYGLIGPNGSGKTTTIKMMLGMIKPTKGIVKVFGKEIRLSREEILKNIGALVEGPAFYGDLNAYDNMRIVALMKNVSTEKIRPILETMGLEKTQNKKVKEFSLGMKQRLGIAQALLGDPTVLILDEPVNGLDPSGIHEIRELILALRNKKDITFFISSHILSEIEMIADDIIALNEGKILYSGELNGLKDVSKGSSLEEAYLNLLEKKECKIEW